MVSWLVLTVVFLSTHLFSVYILDKPIKETWQKIMFKKENNLPKYSACSSLNKNEITK